uniref:Uncharacterized protein n=1 Tax=Euplotes crassus TaxID=5936 RepID=A0A7S3NV95_EUPCR|mmetsp:Transcript_23745/g.23653  ORF Transcript_23745/g.23653 Transcript_23745/m.23653 type:complete len:210 (+) Transcript_23745:123-752(+)
MKSSRTSLSKKREMQSKSPQWMMFDNYYEHPSPWKRSVRQGSDLSKTPYFFTGDERHSVMHREVHLLPRSYKSPENKPPMKVPKKDCYEFCKPDRNFMTKVGKMLLKKGIKDRKKLDVSNRNKRVFEENNKRRIIEEIQRKAPKWNINVKTRQQAFATYAEDRVHVRSDKQRYDDLVSFNTAMKHHDEKPFNKYDRGRRLFSVDQGALI